MARTQVIVQFTDHLLAALDQHVVQAGRSRSDVIREAVGAYLGSLPEAEADRRLIESYTKHPQDEVADDQARGVIAEEPW